MRIASITIGTIAILLSHSQVFAFSVDDCVQDCWRSVQSRGVTNSGMMNICSQECYDQQDLERKHQQEDYDAYIRQYEQNKDLHQQELELEKLKLENEKMREERERQNRESDTRSYQQLLDILRETTRCPRNSRGMTAAEKENSPGYGCVCMEGFAYEARTKSCMKPSLIHKQPFSAKSSSSSVFSKKLYHGNEQQWNEYERSRKKREAERAERNIPNATGIRSRLTKESRDLTTGGNTNKVPKAVPHDVPKDAWFHDVVQKFVDEDLIFEGLSFEPEKDARRGDFIDILVRKRVGNDFTSSKVQSFVDVPPESQYFRSLQRAGQEGWVTGDGKCYKTSKPCNANPYAEINRAEAAALIIRAFDLQEGVETPDFDDVPEDAWFRGGIRSAASHCILRGDKGKKRVRPSDKLNRAEMVVMINRASQGLKYPNCD